MNIDFWRRHRNEWDSKWGKPARGDSTDAIGRVPSSVAATVIGTTGFAPDRGYAGHFVCTTPVNNRLQRPGEDGTRRRVALTFPNTFHDEIDNADGHVCFFAVRRCARSNRCVVHDLQKSSAACETTAVCFAARAGMSSTRRCRYRYWPAGHVLPCFINSPGRPRRLRRRRRRPLVEQYVRARWRRPPHPFFALVLDTYRVKRECTKHMGGNAHWTRICSLLLFSLVSRNLLESAAIVDSCISLARQRILLFARPGRPDPSCDVRRRRDVRVPLWNHRQIGHRRHTRTRSSRG